MFVEERGVLFLLFLSVFVFAYFLLMSLFKVPNLKSAKRVLSAYKKNDRKAPLLKAALTVGKVLPLGQHTKVKLEGRLKMAGLALSPETYVSYALLKGLLYLLVLPVLFLIKPFLPGIIQLFIVFSSPLVVLLSVLTVFNELGKVNDLIKDKKEAISWEMRRFVGALTQELKTHRNITLMLENYQKSAGHFFGEELKITIADMKSGHWENALLSFDSRIGLPEFSEAIRGLIGVLRGDDGVTYFAMLEHDLKHKEYQMLKKKALKRPDKIRRLSVVVLMLFIITYFVIFGIDIAENLHYIQSF